MIHLFNQVFKKVAWNGMCLDVPLEWNIATLGKDHFLMEENNEPVLEITWNRKPRAGGLDIQMQRFSVSVKKRLGIIVCPMETNFISGTPNERPDQKNDLKMTRAGFFWESASSRGRGTLLMCSQCRLIAMLRFFSSYRKLSDTLVEKIVLSFDDQCEKKRINWNMFGLELSIPERFKLLNHRFRPGSFMMDFKAGAERLIVYSWGPASFLLPNAGSWSNAGFDGDFASDHKNSLEQFAKKRVCLPNVQPISGQCDQGYSLIWERPKHSWFVGFFKPYEVFRIVHNIEKNRIIGVKFTSRSKPMDGLNIIQGCIH